MKILTKSTFLKDINSDWVKNFSINRREPSWLTELRVDAFNRTSALPLPDQKNEKWKRTHLSSIPWDKLEFSCSRADSNEKIVPQFNKSGVSLEPTEDGRIPARFFWDLNRGTAIQIPLVVQKKGIEWMTLESALIKKEEEIKGAWEKALLKAENDKFQSLLLAIADGGTCLFVGKGAQIRTPLQKFVGGTRNLGGHFLINFIFLEEGSEVQVWEEAHPSQKNGGDPSFLISQNFVDLKPNSHLQMNYLQNWSHNQVHFQFQEIFQGTNSRFNSVVVAIGGKTFHNEVSIHLNGEKAENKILGVLFGDETQNFENFIYQNHGARKTLSDIQFRGALKGAAKSFFSGLIFIDPKAQQSDAYQSCKFLLLSSEAKADVIPNLEILADDVKCSHGAAVGPVDEEQKFYLETRGIPPKEAEKIILQGFVEPVFAAIPDPVTQQRLRGFIEEKMKN